MKLFQVERDVIEKEWPAYASALKSQMKRSIARKRANPDGIAARMTEAERTLNSGLLAKLGISGTGRTEKRKKTKKTTASGVGTPSSQVFLGTYDNVEASDSSVPRLNPKSRKVSESPFAVDDGAKFDEFRRNGLENSAHATLMRSRQRPGTSDASLYSSLRAGGAHHPRRSRSWFDDE